MDWKDRIVVNPDVSLGKPVIRGTRVPISQVLGALSAGEKIEDILLDYPNISRDDVFAALEFGSKLASFETFDYQTHAS